MLTYKTRKKIEQHALMFGWMNRTHHGQLNFHFTHMFNSHSCFKNTTLVCQKGHAHTAIKVEIPCSGVRMETRMERDIPVHMGDWRRRAQHRKLGSNNTEKQRGLNQMPAFV